MKVRQKTWLRLTLVMALLGLIAFGLAGSTQAADFRGGDIVVIEANEVIDDDLFVSGARIEMNGLVKGDLFGSGNEVIVNGEVEGSAVIAGQTLQVNGRVGGSLYGGGYSLTLGAESEVGRNLYFGGFSLRAEDGSAIGRSLYSGAYQIILDGEVAGDVAVGGGALELNGSVGGDVTGEVGGADEGGPPFMPAFPGSVAAVAPGFRMGENAQVGGDVTVKVTTAEERSAAVEQRGIFGLSRTVLQRVGEFIALVIVGGLLLQFGPNLMGQASQKLQEQPLPSAGWGCLITLIFAIAVPIVAVVILIVALLGGLVTFGQLFNDILSLGGAALILIVTAFLFVLALITKIVVAFLGGRLILARLAPQMEPGFARDLSALAIGAFIYEILRAIPFGLGWVVGVIVTLVGLGALYFVLREWLRPSALEMRPAGEAVA